jgi:hypothetical protein
MRLIDIKGQVFGRLTVIRKSTEPSMWECECACGKKKNFSGINLRSGNSTSCGCYHREKLAEYTRATRTYDKWLADMSLYKRKLKYRRPRSKLGSNQFSACEKAVQSHPSLQWGLTLEEYVTLVTGNCFYCGLTPSQPVHGAGMSSMRKSGIDRVDNTKGYELSNCVSCCSTCNRDKRAQTQNDFIQTTCRRYMHLRSKGLLTETVTK